MSLIEKIAIVLTLTSSYGKFSSFCVSSIVENRFDINLYLVSYEFCLQLYLFQHLGLANRTLTLIRVKEARAGS